MSCILDSGFIKWVLALVSVLSLAVGVVSLVFVLQDRARIEILENRQDIHVTNGSSEFENIPCLFEMRGTYTCDIKNGNKLCIFINDGYNFYPQAPFATIIEKDKTWVQTNIRCASRGDWKIYICIADKSVANLIQSDIDKFMNAAPGKGKWPVYPTLPEGVHILKSVNAHQLNDCTRG